MLERYTLNAMRHLWSPEHKVEMWAAVAAAQSAAQSNLPEPEQVEWIQQLLAYPLPTQVELRDMETLVRHDVVAFLAVWREQMGPDHARSIHLGLTSSDLVDTAQNAILGQVTDEIMAVGESLMMTLARAALRHWSTERLGRTHGQPAEVTSFGYQLARHATAVMLNLGRIGSTTDDLMLFKMSGPVGTYRHTSLEQERRGATLIGGRFSAAEVAGQRLPRENYARWVSELAILASSVEDLALQIRLGQQFGIEEVAEASRPDQVGSSSMPHKRNPIRSENLAGLARLVRAQVVPVMEGIPTWNDRDISHSSVERVALQAASTLTHYMLAVAQNLVDMLEVDHDRMTSNLLAAGHRVHSASMKVQLVREGASPNQVDWAANKIVERYTNSEYDFPHPAPPMRIEHVRHLMEEIIRGTN